MPNRDVKLQFSIAIEKWKSKYKFDTYMEALIDFIECRIFDDIDYDNVRQFLTDGLKEKIFNEGSNKNYIKNEFKVKENKLMKEWEK